VCQEILERDGWRCQGCGATQHPRSSISSSAVNQATIRKKTSSLFAIAVTSWPITIENSSVARRDLSRLANIPSTPCSKATGTVPLRRAPPGQVLRFLGCVFGVRLFGGSELTPDSKNKQHSAQRRGGFVVGQQSERRITGKV